MIMTMNLLDLPFDRFKYLILNYSQWINDINKSAFLYIEVNRVSIEEAAEIIQILQQKSLIDLQRVENLINEYIHDQDIKEHLKDHLSDEEKEWIVYYSGTDVGHRVKARNYTDALLEAYMIFGADGKISKVEEASKKT